MDHARDEDCTLNDDGDGCIECGVSHGDPCARCGGRGFHRDGCPVADCSCVWGCPTCDALPFPQAAPMRHEMTPRQKRDADFDNATERGLGYDEDAAE